ncbi:hypothetical protein [Nocardia sp. NPDC003963]
MADRVEVDSMRLAGVASEAGAVAGRFDALLSMLEERAAFYEGREGNDETGLNIAHGYNSSAANLKDAVRYVRDQLLQHQVGLQDAAVEFERTELANEVGSS